MAFCEVKWSSAILGRALGMNVFLPSVGKPPYPVFYLLHGLSDDYSIWQRRTRLEVYAANLPLIIVMPDGLRNFYTDNEVGPAYGKYIGEELPSFIEQHFRTKTTRDSRCIGGLSMGGYGALRNALKYADRYCSVHSHSGALIAHTFRAEEDEFKRVFGENADGTDHDIIHLAKQAKTAGNLPAIRIDCGTEDFLIDHNRQVHRELKSLEIPHQYEEFPGSHNWTYWDQHIQEALRFHAENLGIKPIV